MKNMEKRQIEEIVSEIFDDISLEELVDKYSNIPNIRFRNSIFGIEVFYYREETEDELISRLIEERKKREEQDAQDRMTYLILKAKFEPHVSH